MMEFKYTITDSEGIHARPAGMLVKQAAGYKSDIKITKGEKSAD
ncbi:MAG TPA: HPr family phosphocarrier protein, partial [Lachnospiraceae bacterium]|nr:HPr family phosphocarrier protein [Lachnospiraceae bacterium]HCR83773.1 HPr family phosphocarrier protein [Lachnospiraceae bacterium]